MALTREEVIRKLQKAGTSENLNLSRSRFVKGINLASFDLRGVNLARTHLPDAHFEGANLSGANLKGAWLLGANLSGANLKGANLGKNKLPGFYLGDMKTEWLVGPLLFLLLNQGADLVAANLSGTDLSGVDLSGFNLSRANLTGANLYRANLTGAKLKEASLEGANLSGANLSGAKLKGARLEGANLSGATISQKQLGYARTLQGATMLDAKVNQPSTVFVEGGPQQQPLLRYAGYPGTLAVRQPKNGLAIAGFVLGIIGLLSSWLLFGALLCIPGIVLSAVGMRRSGDRRKAIAGLVLSIIGIIIAVAIIVIANLSK